MTFRNDLVPWWEAVEAMAKEHTDPAARRRSFGERADEVLHDPRVASALDDALKRLAGLLDPTDTDEGMERVGELLHDRLRAIVANEAVRHGWKLPP